jgi:NADH-quinone oxidoreductase subunit L
VIVNGSARVVDKLSRLMRQTQSGFLFHYAFAMVVGLVAILAAFVLLR